MQPSIKEFPEPALAASALLLRRAPADHPLTPPRFHCVGRRRLDRLGQGVSKGEARPGGKRRILCRVSADPIPRSMRRAPDWIVSTSRNKTERKGEVTSTKVSNKYDLLDDDDRLATR